MRVYILRHGVADEPRPGLPDKDRQLTKEGRKGLERVLKSACDAGVRPALVLSSPLARAIQTAEMAIELLGCEKPMVKTKALAPGSNPAGIWVEIRSHKDESAILLAGHEPLLSATAGFLLGTPALQIDLKKGALIRIDLHSEPPQPRGVLVWLITPKLACA
ncbi:MAG: SixA phosphatase family protein [Bryobacteraceae bacterium]